jgi:hypothetical protein
MFKRTNGFTTLSTNQDTQLYCQQDEVHLKKIEDDEEDFNMEEYEEKLNKIQ